MSGFEPPPDVPVEVDHDGVLWTIGARRLAAELAVLALLSAALPVVGAISLDARLGLLVVFPLAAAGALGVEALRRTRVRITDRAVVVERRALGGTTITRLPIDELASVTVAERDGEALLVFRTRERTLAVGAGRPRNELDCIVAAVAAAQEAFGRRERAEGREWTFLRRVPEGLERLRG